MRPGLVIAFQRILNQEGIGQVADHRVACKCIERIEIPPSGPGQTPDEFRLRPQPDFFTGDVKGTPVDIDRRVRTEPDDQLRNLLWMSGAIESDQSAIPNPVPTQCSG